MSAPSDPIAQRLGAAVEKRLGVSLDARGLCDLVERLYATRGIAAADALVAGLESGGERELLELVPTLTVGETYFFRHRAQFDALASLVARGELGKLRLSCLSAACASGEEPYSLAMVLDELGGAAARGATIAAFDVNPVALERARTRRYAAWSLRETSAEAKRRWFAATGGGFEISPVIAESVTFVEGNLTVDDDELFREGAYDVVFCRNVLMYFTREQAARAVARIARSLVPGGYLFLGHAETLRGLSHDYQLCHADGAFYYRRRGSALQPAPETAGPGVRDVWTLPSSDWVEAIGDATRRIEALSASTPPGSAMAGARQADLSEPLRLLGEERFEEALGLLGSPGHRAAASDPEHRLLEAALYVQTGRLHDAERACEALLSLDGLDGEVYHLLGLCHEGRGRVPAALEAYRMAAHLAPTFSLPRFQLGLLLRRWGEAGPAREALSEARALLEREDASRILLFGGGFGRAALLACCNAELAALEARS